MKTLPWLLVVLLVVGIALPTHGQSLDFEITFGNLIHDVSIIKSALGIYGSSSEVVESLDKRVHDLEFAKTLTGMSGNSEFARKSRVDLDITTLDGKIGDLQRRLETVEGDNELLRDRVKDLEDSAAPHAVKRPSNVPRLSPQK